GGRLSAFDQLRDGADALVGGGDRLDRVGHRVEQAAEVGRAAVERIGGEEVRRVVERAIHLLAGGETILSLAQKLGRRLQVEQVGANGARKYYFGHDALLFWDIRCRSGVSS